jgi:putative transposase
MPYEVHLLVEVDPVFAIHRLIKPIKGCSLPVLWLHLRRPSLWTNSNVAAVRVVPISGISTTLISRKAVDSC